MNQPRHQSTADARRSRRQRSVAIRLTLAVPDGLRCETRLLLLLLREPGPPEVRDQRQDLLDTILRRRPRHRVVQLCYGAADRGARV